MIQADKHDRIMRPFMSIMRPTRLPQDIVLRVVLYLIPLPALRWIQHDFHYSRHVRVPTLHEIFGMGCLPSHIDLSRYRGEEMSSTFINQCEHNQWRLPPSRIAPSRNHLHDTISRIHLALLNIVYWAPMSSLSRQNVIRTIKICRRHEKQWFYLRPHYPLRTYSFTSRFIICDIHSNRVLTSIEWPWHISDMTIWHACPLTHLSISEPPNGELNQTNRLSIYHPPNGEPNPTHSITTRHIERDDPDGNPWHPGYYLNGTPCNQPTNHLPACAFSIPMSAQHTQQLTHSIQQCRHSQYSVHFDILNNDYCLTSHLLVGQMMTIPTHSTQQTTSHQQQQQHNLTNIMHTPDARRGYTITDTATHIHTSDVFFSFRNRWDCRIQRTLMRHLAQNPHDDGNMNGFDLIVQRRPPATQHNVHNKLIQQNPPPQDK